MTRWFFSLQFRLILGFAVVLMLALAAVGIYSNLAAQREVRELRTAADEALIARVQEAFTEFYAETGSWSGVASTVERVSYLTGREIAILDREGKVLVATRRRSESERPPHDQDYTSSRIVVGGDHVGSVLIGPVASRRTFRPYRGGDRSPPGPAGGPARNPGTVAATIYRYYLSVSPTIGSRRGSGGYSACLAAFP